MDDCVETYRKCEIELLKVMKLVLLRFSLGKSGNGNPRERERERKPPVLTGRSYFFCSVYGVWSGEENQEKSEDTPLTIERCEFVFFRLVSLVGMMQKS